MNNLRGAALMTASMLGFALEDTFIKTLTKTVPTSQILILLGLGGAFCFAILMRAQRGTFAPLVAPDLFRAPAIIRNIGEAGAAIAFITALALVPISTVAAVFQATPLAITAGAALFMGERVGWRRWAAIMVGFLGVLMIIRPGGASFEWTMMLPLIAVVGVAFRDLATRRLDPDTSSVAVSFYGFLALAVSGVLMLPFGAAPITLNTPQMLLTLGGILCGTAGYYAIVQAMRMAEASAVMPFRYTRLVFSMTLGFIVFAERPDLWTILGALVIIMTGFYTFLREARAQKTG